MLFNIKANLSDECLSDYILGGEMILYDCLWLLLITSTFQPSQPNELKIGGRDLFVCAFFRCGFNGIGLIKSDFNGIGLIKSGFNIIVKVFDIK